MLFSYYIAVPLKTSVTNVQCTWQINFFFFFFLACDSYKVFSNHNDFKIFSDTVLEQVYRINYRFHVLNVLTTVIYGSQCLPLMHTYIFSRWMIWKWLRSLMLNRLPLLFMVLPRRLGKPSSFRCIYKCVSIYYNFIHEVLIYWLPWSVRNKTIKQQWLTISLTLFGTKQLHRLA